MIFNRKKDEDFDDEIDEVEIPRRKFKDLNPEDRKARKEPPKPWGEKERYFVLFALLVTVLTSGVLALSARNFKLPKLQRLEMPKFTNINPFKEQIITVGNSGSNVSQEKIENTKKLFKEATNNYSGIYSFYIYDLNGDYYYGFGHQEKMQAASLIKLPVIYALYKEFEEGKLDLSKHKNLIEVMGKRSDNTAFNNAVELLGKEKINKTIIDLGMVKTSYENNTTTPEEIGIFFKKLYKNEILNKSDSSEFQGYMTDTIFEKWLRVGIPENINLIHKYGREVNVVNDAGIVMTKNPFVIVIMTDGVVEKEADELFPKLTELLYNEHTNENNN